MSNTASIVAGAVGSISANISLNNSINHKHTNYGYSSWTEYNCLKSSLLDKSLEEKLDILKKLKCFKVSKNLTLAIDVYLQEVEFELNKQYYDRRKDNLYLF